MKVHTYQADDERSILTGMIVSDRILLRIVAHLKGEKKPFRSKWSNIVARWCLEFAGRYAMAPKKSIVPLFRQWAEATQDEEAVQLVEGFLTSLSQSHASASELNEDHLLDMASRFFNEVKLERLVANVEADLLRKDVEAAREHVATHVPVSLGSSDMVDVLTDTNAVKEALTEEEHDVLIHYPGPLGEFFGSHLCRDALVAYLAPEKRGKSFWLIDAAWRAATAEKRRTLFYSVGDMTQRQMMRRLLTRACRRPLRAGEVSRPVRIKRRAADGEVAVQMESKLFDKPLSLSKAQQVMRGVWEDTAHRDSLLKMRCTANSTTRVADIEADLDGLAQAGWVADVVVIDYADILAPEGTAYAQDFRHQTNETWKALRRLSQKHHCLVLTATQSDAASYSADTLRRSHFSEDKRKLAHVTGMAGINQTEGEKERGLYRLNWIVLREDVFLESRCVTAAGALALANPAIRSIW